MLEKSLSGVFDEKDQQDAVKRLAGKLKNKTS